MDARSLGIEMAAATIRGRRKTNADAFLIDDAAGILAVADGMGDEERSALVARLALAAVRERFSAPWSQRPAAERSVSEATERFVRGILLANQRTYEVRTPEAKPIGTTFAGLVVCGDFVCIAHVGDSRAYLFRRATGDLVRLTEDDTVMSRLLQRGMSQEEAARAHNADALTRALGTKPAVEPQPSVAPWAPGDVALVCTDGLSDGVHIEAMTRILAETIDVQEAAERLVDAAGDVGGWDNATVVMGRNVCAGRRR